MQEINALTLRERLEANDAIEVVDIRDQSEFDSWHIFGSRNVPVYSALKMGDDASLMQRANELPKDKTLVTVCRAGFMSQRAAILLGSLGFDVLSLNGGIRGWGAVWSVAPIEMAREGATMLQVRRNGKGCLSYLFGVGGEAAVVDPSVDVDAYLELAKSLGLKIVQVIETHVHADHLSRARELARLTGADLLMPENDRVQFDYQPIHDGTKMQLGGLEVEAIATPGHTGESCCYLVDGQLLLTGDTLFATAVGRPDLERGDEGADAGAHALFASLHEKLLKRFDAMVFYPAHTAGPVGFDQQPICGRFDEIREQQELLKLDEPAFVDRVLASLQEKPPNHHGIIAVNEGTQDLGGVDPLDVEAGPNRCAAG